MLPKITELEFNTEGLTEDLPPIGTSFLFDFNTNEFVMTDGKLVELYGIDSLKMWIEKSLRTERFRFVVYENTEYSISLEDLIGSNYPRSFVEAEIKREVTERMLEHPHINAIENWSFERDGKLMRIWFKVITADDEFEMEVMM